MSRSPEILVNRSEPRADGWREKMRADELAGDLIGRTLEEAGVLAATVGLRSECFFLA